MTRADFRKALRVDEVGIETAVLGELRLRSAYRPVFRRCGERLELVAGQAVTVAGEDGAADAGADPVPLDRVADRQFLAILCQALHVENYRNFDAPDCDLIVDHDLSCNRQLFEIVAEAGGHAEAVGLEAPAAHRIICHLAGPAALAPADRARALAELRAAGFRIAVDLFDGRDSVADLRPEMVQVGAPWTAKIAREPAAAALLRQLALRHRAAGARVLVGGIATRTALDLALGIGADWLAGDVIAAPQLAGTMIDRRPLPIARLRETSPIDEAPAGAAAVLRFERTPRR